MVGMGLFLLFVFTVLLYSKPYLREYKECASLTLVCFGVRVLLCVSIGLEVRGCGFVGT